MKPTKPEALDVAGEAPPPALVDLLAAKAEFRSVKGQAFRELKSFSRKLVGLTLLLDDLQDITTIDELAAKVRQERDALILERDALAADTARLRVTGSELRSRNDELMTRAAELTQRVEALELSERGLVTAVQRYENLSRDHESLTGAVATAQQSLTDLRAEETRLSPLVANAQKIERGIVERQQVLDGINAAIVELRSRIG